LDVSRDRFEERLVFKSYSSIALLKDPNILITMTDIRIDTNKLAEMLQDADRLIAYYDEISRIFTDREHRDMWDRQIKETKDLLKKAEVENVLAGLHK
jgi:hypothetical protein